LDPGGKGKLVEELGLDRAQPRGYDRGRGPVLREPGLILRWNGASGDRQRISFTLLLGDLDRFNRNEALPRDTQTLRLAQRVG
jgi:hypothetical protein